MGSVFIKTRYGGHRKPDGRYCGHKPAAHDVQRDKTPVCYECGQPCRCAGLEKRSGTKRQK